jgi:hypothetical protein
MGVAYLKPRRSALLRTSLGLLLAVGFDRSQRSTVPEVAWHSQCGAG